MGFIVFNKKGDYTGFLGNVMFQVAATIGLAKKYGMTALFADTGYFNPDFFSWFNGPFDIASVNSLSEMECIDLPEPNFSYHEFSLDPNKNYNLTGYFQSKKYWDHCTQDIFDTFRFSNKVTEMYSRSSIKRQSAYVSYFAMGPDVFYNAVSIHIRRGDYLNLQEYHPQQPIAYYQAAAEQMVKWFPQNNLVFIIFSDDIEWCKNNLTAEVFNNRLWFSEGNAPIVDLYLQSCCLAHIICNSTFGYWASMLNNRQSKKIIAPAKNRWFGPARQTAEWSVDDLYEQNWFII